MSDVSVKAEVSQPGPEAPKRGERRRRPILRYVLRRVVIVPISLFVLGSVCFVLVLFIPGDPAVTILGDFATPEQVALVNEQLGLDQPLWDRYVSFWGNLLQGDLGTSFFTNQPVLHEIALFLPNTIELVVLALLVAVSLGLVIGVLGAYFARRWPDRVMTGLTSGLQSVPDFFLALVGIYVFFFLLGWAPAPIGRLPIEAGGQQTPFLIFGSLFSGDWTTLGQALSHAALPVMSLGLVYSSYFAKTARGSMGTALTTPQVEFARACGLRERTVVRYAFLASRTTVITYIAILFGSLLGGAAIVERVFNWRGMGQWALDGVLKVDVPIIQGFVVTAGLMTLTLFLVLDLVVLALDPRVSYE
ncbi:ABC transporter permease [Actinokineospora pegani]|uniref:ABC transporter permease n=1 Tax=Actinokineospora pegani TaxID=2654637 RepID=UPI0018D27670|nr:ABC transporter permease [Actinokineospora pegani]